MSAPGGGGGGGWQDDSGWCGVVVARRGDDYEVRVDEVELLGFMALEDALPPAPCSAGRALGPDASAVALVGIPPSCLAPTVP